MLRWLEHFCVAAENCQIRLEVRASNLTARQFYKKHGYDEIQQLAAYYGKQETAIVMSKTLMSLACD